MNIKSLIRRLYQAFLCKSLNVKSSSGGGILAHSFLRDYKNHKVSYLTIAKTHLKGWTYSDWSLLSITNENRKHYLSTSRYCSLHPLNGNFSKWIDDKLTLKYLLNGTTAGQYMPDYYFYFMENGSLVALMDCPEECVGRSIEGIVQLLESKKILALKLVSGSLGIGFYKAEYDGRNYLLNGERFSRDDFARRISSLRGYLVTEYLLPHPDIARFCDKTVGCLRYLIGRMKNGELIEIHSYMRFGTKQSRFVENYNSGGVLAIVKDGHFDVGNVLDFKNYKNVIITHHSDNGLILKGEIPMWDEIKKAARMIADTMPQMSYLGLDFCITHESKVKVIEINSLTSLDGIQIDGSIFDTPAGVFFKERLNNTHI